VNADAGGYQILLDFGGAAVPLRTFSLGDLLAGRVDPRHITDRIVLIGVTAESVPDLFHIPVRFGLRGGDLFPGVFLHGIVIEQLLAAAIEGRAPIHVMSETAEIGWILLWGMLGGALGVFARSPWRFSLIAVGGLLLLTVIVISLFWSGWWVPEAPAALTWFVTTSVVVASTLGRERKERALLMQLFSRHVSREVAQSIWQQRDQLLESGRPRPQELVATVLFLDFKGYTAASEKMSPQALMAWVNAYLDAMTQVIMRHDGVIDDYAGDSIKANFGVPLKRESNDEVAKDAINAVACALAMEQEMHRMNERHEGNGLPTVGMRIGIHTGPVLAGCVGSAERMKYTTVGDTVNAAARLESLDRDVVSESPGRRPCRILISDTTAHLLGDRFQPSAWRGQGAQAIVTYRVAPSRSRSKPDNLTMLQKPSSGVLASLKASQHTEQSTPRPFARCGLAGRAFSAFSVTRFVRPRTLAERFARLAHWGFCNNLNLSRRRSEFPLVGPTRTGHQSVRRDIPQSRLLKQRGTLLPQFVVGWVGLNPIRERHDRVIPNSRLCIAHRSFRVAESGLQWRLKFLPLDTFDRSLCYDIGRTLFGVHNQRH
jgi:adenylate cyclase